MILTLFSTSPINFLSDTHYSNYSLHYISKRQAESFQCKNVNDFSIFHANIYMHKYYSYELVTSVTCN